MDWAARSRSLQDRDERVERFQERYGSSLNSKALENGSRLKVRLQRETSQPRKTYVAGGLLQPVLSIQPCTRMQHGDRRLCDGYCAHPHVPHIQQGAQHLPRWLNIIPRRAAGTETSERGQQANRREQSGARRDAGQCAACFGHSCGITSRGLFTGARAQEGSPRSGEQPALIMLLLGSTG